MKWVVDENIDRAVVAWLQDHGHSVWYVAEMSPSTSDEEVLDLARRESAILLTADKDYGELVFRQGRATAGVVLLRLAGLPAREKARIVGAVVAARTDDLVGAFSVITPKSVRVRQRRP